MSSPSSRHLADLLGHQLPASFSKLSSDDLATLSAAVGQLRHKRQQHMQDATEEALRHVPVLLRGAVRKILLG